MKVEKSEVFQHFFDFSSRITSAGRPSVWSEPNDVLPELFTTLDAVMAGGAKALEIVWIEEQRLVTPMWSHMVTHRRWCYVLLL